MRSMLPAALLAAALSVVPAALHPSPAHAQADDWAVTRDPFDKSVVARYKALLAKNPNDASALAKLLSLYRRYRTVDQLRAEYARALEKKPDDWASLVVSARLALAAGDAAAALAAFEKALATRADPAVALELGTLHRNAGRSAEARAAFEKALPGKAQKTRALRALADLALAGGDLAAARAYFDQYIAAEPRNAQLRLELGDALLQAGQHADAAAVYRDAEKLLGADPARRVEVVARIGQALETKGDEDGAIAEYRRAIQLAPKGYYVEVELTARIVDLYRRKQALPALVAIYEKDWPAARRGHFEWDTLARLYEETGDQDKAIAAYRKAVQKAPWELETQRRLITLLENVGKDAEALAQIEAVVRVAPGEARFQIDLAERHWRRGEAKKALDALRRLETRFPGDAGIQSAIADLYMRWGKDDLALAAFERLTRLEPNEAGHLVTLGEQYFQRGDKAKAVAIWKRIANAKTAAAYAKLGEVLAEHGMPADALAHYGRAIKLEPDNADLYKGRAQVHEGSKAYADALADWEKVLTLLPGKPGDRAMRRDARRRVVSIITRWGSKESEYRQRWLSSFRKTPPDVEAGYFLVELYQRRPQSAEPRTTLEKLTKLVPDDQDALADLVKAYRSARMYDQAVAKLLDLAKLNPSRERDVYSQIAEIKREARQDGEAMEWMRKALAKSPNDPVAYERLAEGFVEMQRFADAIAAYEKTIQLDARNFKAHFALAQLYVQSDRALAAAELYRGILRRASDEDVLARAGREAMDLEEMTQTLGELEKVVAPLSFTLSHKPVYRRILVDLYLRYVPRLAERGRRGPPEIKKAVDEELKRLGAHGLKPLLEALHDEKDVGQQRVAVEVLGHLGNRGAAAPLVHLARQEPPADADARRRIGTLTQTLEWEVRVKALIAAGRLADPGVLDLVIPLTRHAEVAMREAAIFTLGRTGDRRAVPALIEGLADRRESVQALACLGLAQVDDGRAITAMTQALADRRRHDLARAACAYGLGARRAGAAVPTLVAALGDGAGEAQRLSAWALGAIGDGRALAPLVRAYFGRADGRRDEMAWALARLAGGAPESPAADLRSYPTHGSKFQTEGAVAALPGPLPAASGPSQVVAAHPQEVIAGLKAALGQHRDVVVVVLADLDAHDGALGLGRLLPAGAIDGKTRATLATIGHGIAPDVAAHLGHADAKVRALAVAVLAKIDSRETDRAVAAAFADKARLVRQAAMRAVVTLSKARGKPTPALRDALATALGGGAWEDRTAAATAMGELGAGADAVALARALGDDIAFVREAAASALGRARAGRNGADPSTDALITASRDPVADVRRAAAAALVAIGDPRARGRLDELATDPDPSVRAAIAK
jgi:tetratricopeptide (TPR) repeat protein